jgi:hypothetical protein
MSDDDETPEEKMDIFEYLSQFITPEEERDFRNRFTEIKDETTGRTRQFFLQRDNSLIEVITEHHSIEEAYELWRLTRDAGGSPFK